MVKTPVDFELKQPLEKTAQEALDEIIERFLTRTMSSGSPKEIQALAKATKDIAIAKAVLSKAKS